MSPAEGSVDLTGWGLLLSCATNSFFGTNAPSRFLLHPNAWKPAAHTAQRGARTQTPGGGTRDTEPAGDPCSAFQVRRGARVVQAFLSLFSTGPPPCLPRAPVAKNHAPNCSEESKEGASFWSVTEQKSIPNLDSSQHYNSGQVLLSQAYS